MISEGIDSERMCFVTTLLLACLGFFSGIVTWTGTAGARLSTFMAARYARDIPSAVPRLPRGVFFSLLLAAVPLIKGWCALFPSRIFVAIIVAFLGVSTGTWLLVASAFQKEADLQRKAHIEQFISSAPGSAPSPRPHFDEFPGWLRAWEGINVTVYLFLMASVLYLLVTLSNR